MLYLSSQQKRLRRGTSLIEVLVVLVVLVVGVLAIARLFPAGFLSLRGAENNSYASRLAQGTLDVLRQDNASLADGIYMYQNGTFDPSLAPDNLKPMTPGTPTAYDDINKQRYISNETVTVPAAQGGVQASLHIVNFGPFEPNTLTVNGALWTAKNGDSRVNPSDSSGLTSIDNPVDQLRAGEQTYLVDLQAGKIAVPPAAYPQTFVLTVNGGASVAVTVPANPPGGTYIGNWFGTTNTQVTGTALPAAPWASVELYRPYQQVAAISNFDTDPYEYALYNPNVAAAGMQTVAFNPLAGGRAGVQPLLARLSYSTQDWHILHQDIDVPAISTGGTGTIRLALSGLKKAGDTQFDQTLFNGLGGSAFDIHLLDRDTGKFYGLTGSGGGTTQTVTNMDDNSVGTGAPIASVSYLNGRITFPDTFSTDDPLPSTPANEPRVKHLRVFYAGVADWAVAVQKAPKFYVMKVSDLTGPLDTGYVTNPPAGVTPNRAILDLTVVAGVQHKQVAFPRCDAGKMVQITISSYQDTAATGGKAYGGQPPLSMPIPVPLDASGVQFIDVSNLLPSTETIDPASVKITVTGLSARALVIWHERDNWKSRSIDTLLTHLD